jgi:hypothetical protein
MITLLLGVILFWLILDKLIKSCDKTTVKVPQKVMLTLE